MRIEELVIDGFKSYAVRTVISGWDPEFNAITGLNGSGKSNILDAICFVLGITNMNQATSNMQELIYKRGQAGVNKASVTIVFNNEDRENSPVGFEQYNQITVTRQIIMGGQSKYIVNGHRAQQQAVGNLFQSVQLNINNPHFLIMQGRITKVLNMKPPEILSMIEEAAGTRMFEERKEKALKTIAKKEKKVEEINELLNEEIGPKLDKLRTEKRSYLEFQKTESDIERLSRLVIAFEYTKYKDKLDKSGADFDAKRAKVHDLEMLNEQLKMELEHLEEDIKQTTRNKEKEIGKGGKIQELEREVTECSNKIVRIRTKCDLNKASIADEIKNKNNLLSGKAEIEESLKQKNEESKKLEEQFESIRKAYDEKKEQVRKAEELLQTLSTGVSAQEGHENGYMEQLQEAKNNVTQALTEIEQAKLKASHLTKELKEKEPQALKAQRDNRGLINNLEFAKRSKQELEAKLSQIDWDPNRDEDILQKRSAEQNAIQELNEKCESLAAEFTNLQFTYSDPEPNFDRRKVKGLIAELIALSPQYVQCSTALEICAGGRLYNVVVENEKVGAQLLEKGKLKKRVTIIPLNKIKSFKVSAEKVATAQKIAPGKVDLALMLIGYEPEVTVAMEYVFGSTLICSDADTASKITFDKRVLTKSVTFDGDVYDPSGTLQGGSKPSSAGILAKMQAWKDLKKKLNSHQRALDGLNEKLNGTQRIKDKYNQIKQELDLKTHEVTLLEEQINKNSNSQILHVIENIRAQIAEQENIIKTSKEKHRAAISDCKRIEREMNEFKNNRDSKLKDIERLGEQKSVSKGKSELAQNSQVVTNMQRQVQILQLEIKQLEEDIKNSNAEIENSDSIIRQLTESDKSMDAELNKIMGLHSRAQSELDKELQILSAYDEEIKDLQNAFLKEKEATQQAIQQMEKEHDWILHQRHHFGEPNTAYDFKNQNPVECKKMLRKLEEKHSNMRKKINAKVMNMIDSVEKKEASLKQMLATVQKDKKKIEDTIVSLDNYKKDALNKTWKKVDADFGAIFGDLLPSSFATLRIPEGKELTEGLEVKVQLGGVWKQSLAELSGGQRSLVALSLILSLLQFKPAPMYILDEVDAALDLSHTQNIGQLLRTRFKGSQFIVVSLKDGMFNNANVLFRTRFRDGTSVVEKTAQKQDNTRENDRRRTQKR
ncbi:5838_t:CDS:10 [Acaulospora colombiana]|uniref:5838_t:CDS:1 n=1 Tax=Acaulospora colombiana TaxID=27376 RepID=A0ACA9LAE4_9GLOM|nr:5838_t:CDS:10 [Acaulospora colombiana]